MDWKIIYTYVINELKYHQHCKSDSYYFYLKDTVQFLNLSIKESIIIPCAVSYLGTNVGDLYMITTPGWEYIYHYLHKYIRTSSTQYPLIVNYDYIHNYKYFMDIIKDKYDYLELDLVTDILYPSYYKWLSNYNTIQTIFPNKFVISLEYDYYEWLLYEKLMKHVRIYKYNDDIIRKYLIIKPILPDYVNIIQYLLM